jgi:hypothetical protein
MLLWFVIFIFTVLENRKLQAGAYILESLRHMDFGQLMAESNRTYVVCHIILFIHSNPSDLYAWFLEFEMILYSISVKRSIIS